MICLFLYGRVTREVLSVVTNCFHFSRKVNPGRWKAVALELLLLSCSTVPVVDSECILQAKENTGLLAVQVLLSSIITQSGKKVELNN